MTHCIMNGCSTTELHLAPLKEEGHILVNHATFYLLLFGIRYMVNSKQSGLMMHSGTQLSISYNVNQGYIILKTSKCQ